MERLDGRLEDEHRDMLLNTLRDLIKIFALLHQQQQSSGPYTADRNQTKKNELFTKKYLHDFVKSD